MTTLSLELKNADSNQINQWIAYLRSLDFVQAIREKEVAVSSYLLLSDICQLHPNEWVLLADTQTDGMRIMGGRVILHNPNKHQFALEGRDLVKQHTNVRHYYTGERPAHQKHIGVIVRQNKTTAL